MINRLEEWRQNEQLVAWAGGWMNTPEWELLLKVMERGEHVRHFDQNCEALQKLGRIEGWDLFLKRLVTAAVPLIQPEELVSTFEPHEVPEAPKKEK